MYNTVPKLSKLIDDVGIEAALEKINIDDIDDHVIKVILRTIDHSIKRLREELN